MRIDLTIFGVNLGLAWSSKAAAPATRGAETEVPLMYIIFCVFLPAPSPVSKSGLAVTRVLFTASAKINLLPGATRSGLIRLSEWRTPRRSVQKLRVGPREL